MKISRDEAKVMLGENATEEQITMFLNKAHSLDQEKEIELSKAKEDLAKFSDYEELKKYKENSEKSKLTEQEQLELMKQETAKNLKDSKIIVNKAKAKEILSGYDIDDETISGLVTDDEKSLTIITNLKNKMDSLKESVAKQTKEELNTLNLKPDLTNVNTQDEKMTMDKFSQLSADEQNTFIDEHPEEFNNL